MFLSLGLCLFLCRTCNEALEEGFLGEILVVLLHVLFRWGDELQGDELVAVDCVISLE